MLMCMCKCAYMYMINSYINEIKQNVSDNQNRNIISIQTLTKKLILSPEERRLEKVNAYEISKDVLSLIDFSIQ